MDNTTRLKELSQIILLTFIICFATAGKSIGQSFNYNCFNFNVIGETATACVSGYNSDCDDIPIDLVIPEFAIDEWGNSYEVVAICDYAFYYTEIVSVLIPETVTVIGESAFSGCMSLTSLTIPESVESIGAMAFSDCIGITGTLIIPESVTQIGDLAFSNCIGITGVEFGSSVLEINAGSFSGCSGLEGEIIFPNSLSTIGAYAFSSCSGLTSIVIPNSVTSIGSEAFSYCSSVETVFFDANIVFEEVPDFGLVVPYEPFSNCSGVLTVGSSVRIIPKNFFQNCGFSGITIENGLTQIQEYAFYNSSNLSGDLVFPTSLTTIQESAFENCSAFNGQLVLPNSITTLGKCAFKNCTGFTGIEYNISSGSNYNYSGENPFYHCRGALIVGNSVIRIPNYMFCDSYINSAVINAINIGDYAFADCFAMHELTLGENISTFGKGAFNYCSGLETVHFLCNNCSCNSQEGPFNYYCRGTIDIGENVVAIPDFMFYSSYANPEGYGFYGILTIPNSVQSIGNYAFYGNKFTGALIIPDEVTSIGTAAFNGCYGLESITIGESVTTIGNTAFYYCRAITEIIIPNGVTSIGDGAFMLCEGLESITIGASVSSIERRAFDGCHNIKSIQVLAVNPPSIDATTYNNTSLNNAIVQVPCGSLEAYLENDEWNGFNHLRDNCSPNPHHANHLPNGWGWWTPPVPTSLLQLGEALGENEILIISKNGDQTSYENGQWNGTLDTIIPGLMYKVYVNTGFTLTLIGPLASNVNLTIQQGTNWFGYTGSYKTAIIEAISINALPGDKIISQNGGFAIYNGTNWQGTLTQLQPGCGYVYVSTDTEAKTLSIED